MMINDVLGFMWYLLITIHIKQYTVYKLYDIKQDYIMINDVLGFMWYLSNT